jgi:hypothetical protein
MFDLTKTAQVFKKFSLPFLVVIVIFVIIIFWILTKKESGPRVVAPPPPVIKQNSEQNQPSIFDFSKLQIANIPTTLPGFGVVKNNLTNTTVQDTANSLGFIIEPASVTDNTHDGRQYFWDQNGSYFILSQTYLNYKKTLPQTAPTTGLTETDLQKKAVEFAQKIPIIDKNVILNPKKTVYLKLNPIGPPASVGSFEQAQIIEFKYEKELSGFP